MFGPHLLLEAYGSPKEKLQDIGIISDLLDAYPEKLHMTKIMPPYVFKYDGGSIQEDWGLSGVVLIAESHIALHTFPEKGFFTLDIFSCKEFNVRSAVDIALDVFQPIHFDEMIVTRGREFPRSLGRAVKITQRERRRIASVK
ncbi:MAG: S-adenosylmethionine decarboxylase [Candidatus Melainabacteria bacterium]|nr:S-adenosylmethionine decarboxylase [Candidatus Melainabacteria bacterium]MBI3309421.1 S-adenosylmethionine decarboxylase [Candidatus Melainabacteria bacterium]